MSLTILAAGLTRGKYRCGAYSSCLFYAGKTTILKILGGKHMVPKGFVRVLGHSPFHDTQLTGSGDLSYVGGNWDRDVAFAGYSVPLQVGMPVCMHKRAPSSPARITLAAAMPVMHLGRI